MRGLIGVLCMLAVPAWAQTEEEIAAARLAYIAGDYEAAMRVLIPAAEAGDANAQNILGAAHEDGRGVPQDYDLAIEWYQKAADQGWDKALHNLGALFSSGEVATDYARARAYYEGAVALGYGPSFASLGRMYEEGWGVEVDFAKANAIFTDGIAAGDGWSAINLGNNYRLARGVDEDMAQARLLYARAISFGREEGYNALALMVGNGMGGPQDVAVSYTLYREGVARGHGLAGINLAFFVTEVPGFWQNPVEGYGYCLWGIANAEDDQREGFITECEGLVEYLTPEDETAAQLFAETLP